jgi:opacity protein-like surface antigen
MNKFCWTFSLTLCLLTNVLLAQSDFNLTMKAGALRGNEAVKYNNNSFTDNGSSNQDGGCLSIAFSVPVKKSFRIGTEIGVNNFNTFMDYDFRFTPDINTSYLGYYRINQAYLALVPEYRITKFLYINAGVGYYADLTSQFTSGIRINSGQTEDLTGWDYKRHNAVGYFVGAGLCPNITKELALLGEVRYTGCPVSTDSPDQIGISYNAFSFSIGLMYKPKL